MGRTFVVSLPENTVIAEERGSFVLPPGTVISESPESAAVGRAVAVTSGEPPSATDGPSETFAASAPRHIIAAVRERTTGRGAFSRFIARAIANELIDERRRDVLAAMIAEGAAIDDDLSHRLQTLFTRPDR